MTHTHLTTLPSTTGTYKFYFAAKNSNTTNAINTLKKVAAKIFTQRPRFPLHPALCFLASWDHKASDPRCRSQVPACPPPSAQAGGAQSRNRCFWSAWWAPAIDRHKKKSTKPPGVPILKPNGVGRSPLSCPRLNPWTEFRASLYDADLSPLLVARTPSLSAKYAAGPGLSTCEAMAHLAKSVNFGRLATLPALRPTKGQGAKPARCKRKARNSPT